VTGPAGPSVLAARPLLAATRAAILGGIAFAIVAKQRR